MGENRGLGKWTAEELLPHCSGAFTPCASLSLPLCGAERGGKREHIWTDNKDSDFSPRRADKCFLIALTT